MFCPKCGTKALDGATFCQKCGAKLTAGDTVQQAAASTSVQHTQTSNASPDAPKKKKAMKLPIILGAAVLAVVVIIVIAMNWNGKIDYEATVRAHQPFVSQGTSLTYGEVLDKYISSPDWEVRKSGEVNYVDISGKAKGTDNELVVTIKVTEDPSDPDLASISPESVTINGKKSPTQNDAVEFLLAMFSAYDEGYNDLSELLSTGGTGTTGKVNLTETYTNETEGFSFQYPSDWTIMDGQELYDASLDDTAVVSLYAPDGFGSASNVLVNKTQADYTLFDYTKSDFEREFSSIFDEVSVTDLSNVNIDGVPAIELGLLINTDAGPLVVVRYYYIVGDYTYIISGTIRQSAIDSDGLVIDAIMGSYKISTANTSGGSKTTYSVEFPLTVSTDAMNLFAEWAEKHPLVGNYHLDLISDDDVDDEGNKIFLFTLETGGIGMFNMSIRKSDGYMEYISKFDTISMDEWYAGIVGEDDVGADDRTESTAKGQILYNGIPVSSLLETSMDDVTAWLGEPTNVDSYLQGYAYEYNNEILFILDANKRDISWIEISPEALTAGDVSLDKDRAFLIESFGEPTEEYIDEMTREYTISYNMKKYALAFILPDSSSKVSKVRIHFSGQ